MQCTACCGALHHTSTGEPGTLPSSQRTEHMQAVSAGIRPQLGRTQEAGGAALRSAVLSVAQQQKLATCTALLREVAMVYGFALQIDPEVGVAATGRWRPPAHRRRSLRLPSGDLTLLCVTSLWAKQASLLHTDWDWTTSKSHFDALLAYGLTCSTDARSD